MMGDLLSGLSQAASGMRAQSQRLRYVSENIANADTPGYHRKTVNFRQAVDGDVRLGRVGLDPSAPEQIYDPSSPLADATGHYAGSNVDLIVEIADAREASRSYEANLKIFDQIRQMHSDLLSLLKR